MHVVGRRQPDLPGRRPPLGWVDAVGAAERAHERLVRRVAGLERDVEDVVARRWPVDRPPAPGAAAAGTRSGGSPATARMTRSKWLRDMNARAAYSSALNASPASASARPSTNRTNVSDWAVEISMRRSCALARRPRLIVFIIHAAAPAGLAHELAVAHHDLAAHDRGNRSAQCWPALEGRLVVLAVQLRSADDSGRGAGRPASDRRPHPPGARPCAATGPRSATAARSSPRPAVRD